MEYLLPPLGTLTTSMAAMSAGVAPATIRDWRRRGLLTPCGGSPKRPLYRLADVNAARYAAKPTRHNQRTVNAA
ncbi:helix-turn-helix domain-containing protein [Streptomyces sp. NBC_01218]|uniref:MerR family transcriptional regulator n=1 Tax=Streptomyces sp. NBC_01218 TaxID=2903780 RepID=UPI002E12CF33|nr:helix-turn-helix domain-containing protein [Streptomyces sp. NBC_01218]